MVKKLFYWIGTILLFPFYALDKIMTVIMGTFALPIFFFAAAIYSIYQDYQKSGTNGGWFYIGAIFVLVGAAILSYISIAAETFIISILSIFETPFLKCKAKATGKEYIPKDEDSDYKDIYGRDNSDQSEQPYRDRDTGQNNKGQTYQDYYDDAPKHESYNYNSGFFDGYEQARQQFEQERNRQQYEQSRRASSYSANEELKLALATFMLDQPIPLDELKKKKNFLLKKFHPDDNAEDTTEMTQKILEAYEVLKKYAPDYK